MLTICHCWLTIFVVAGLTDHIFRSALSQMMGIAAPCLQVDLHSPWTLLASGDHVDLCMHSCMGMTGLWFVVQAADEAEAGYGGELQQVEQQMAALDEELAKQGGTQAPASECC